MTRGSHTQRAGSRRREKEAELSKDFQRERAPKRHLPWYISGIIPSLHREEPGERARKIRAKSNQEECTELCKKDLHDPDNHDGVITHLVSDILECKVKWAWRSITTNKASGGHEILVELFQILKDDAVKVLHSICQQIWKTQQWPQDWKRPVFIPIPKKGNTKEGSSYCTVALISHTRKIMLKILQARLQQYMNCELPDVHAGFRECRWTRDQIANTPWITEKAREFQKNILLLYWLCQNLWLCGSQQTGNFLNRWQYQTTWPASWGMCVQVKKQQSELDLEKQTGSRWEKECIMAIYCHPAYLTHMHSTSWEMLGWMQHKLESRLLVEISVTVDTQMTPHLWQKFKKN